MEDKEPCAGCFKKHAAMEKLKDQNAELRSFAEEVLQWSEAYPERIFSEPTVEEVGEICKTLCVPLGRISAMILRKFTKPWGSKAIKVLSSLKE